MTKKYRVIKPIKKYETNSVEYYTGKKIETVFHKEHLSQCSKDGEKIFRYGATIVSFSQIEEWIDQGLQPIYFTEEVSKGIAYYDIYEDTYVEQAVFTNNQQQTEWVANLLKQKNKSIEDKIEEIEKLKDIIRKWMDDITKA